MTCIRHRVAAHGITYAYRYFDLAGVSFDELPYVTVLAGVLVRLDTARHTAAELDTLVQGRLGSLRFFAEVHENVDDPAQLRPTLVAGASALSENVAWMAELAREGSDCAIGWEAGEALLAALSAFSDEFASHVERHRCAAGVGQSVPCETDCPAHVNVPGYVALAGAGDCAGAVALIRKDNPFPTACAFVCEHPCETRCRRTLVDAPLNIRGIKRYAVDHAPAYKVAVPAALPASGRRIAVVGAGPSGLTCAYYAALMGHEVHVYESRSQLGGMMRFGIPAYRFPRERLDEDIAAILSAGDITVHAGEAVDAAALERLAVEFDALYVAAGAHGAKALGLEGEDAAGVLSAVELLGAIGEGNIPDFSGKRVVVVGGGNVAMDCARTAVRCGGEVTVVYRRRLEDMTALPAEVEAAIAEGVEMLTLEAPVRLNIFSIKEWICREWRRSTLRAPMLTKLCWRP